MQLNHLDLFSGIGGFTLAARSLNINTKQFVERDRHCQTVLQKHFPEIPIHDDARTFTTRTGIFGIITAGYPCQDNSTANPKGKGLQGKRSGLLYEVFRILEEAQPEIVVLENVPPTQNRRWDETARRELEKRDFKAYRIDLSAKDCGLWHLRNRCFLVGYANRLRLNQTQVLRRFSRQEVQAQIPKRRADGVEFVRGHSSRVFAFPPPGIRRMVDGLPSEMDGFRIHALGNSVPPVMAETVLKVALFVPGGEWYAA